MAAKVSGPSRRIVTRLPVYSGLPATVCSIGQVALEGAGVGGLRGQPLEHAVGCALRERARGAAYLDLRRAASVRQRLRHGRDLRAAAAAAAGQQRRSQ